MANLEIRVSQTGREDVYAFLEVISGAVEVPFVRQEISFADRPPEPRDCRSHAAIVVRFARRTTRADWIASDKKKRIQTTDLYSSFIPGPVFISEHLTQNNKALLQRCKAGVRAKSLAYAWSIDASARWTLAAMDPCLTNTSTSHDRTHLERNNLSCLSANVTQTIVPDVEGVLLSVKTHLSADPVLIPPQQPSEMYACYCASVHKILSIIRILHNILVMGDFNMSRPNWTVILVLTLLTGRIHLVWP
ncbi:hypothetical protein J6590_061502 [Homalodisca vitripennis]|nr:hypothetical protein J6590_061502 [Homalodisca vitripennis]